MLTKLVGLAAWEYGLEGTASILIVARLWAAIMSFVSATVKTPICMDYGAQERFLDGFLTKWLVAAAAVVILGSLALRVPGAATATFFICYLVSAIALSYLPKYLHLHHEPNKRYRWAVRSRWIMAGVVLMVASAVNFARPTHLLVGAACAIWIALVNGFLAVACKRERLLANRWMPLIYFVADFWMIVVLAYLGLNAFLIAGFLAAGIVFALALNQDLGVWFPMLCMVLGAGLVRTAILPSAFGFQSAYLVLCVAIVTAATSWLTIIAVERARRNDEATVAELAEFTKLDHSTISRELVEAHPRLGQAWKDARLDPNDKVALAAWYSEHSLDYLFALAQFHLSYKHIAFTLDVVKLCHGRVLDYGAGKGALAIELARRGMAVTYLDVPGRSREYAEWNARRQGIVLEFTSSKTEIVNRTFDTVLSLDVLEHMPDLAGELRFLTSLLAPGGRLILTIPEGATESQPMHLAHDLSALRILNEQGLRNIKTGWLKVTGSEILRKPHCVVMERA
jgi:2-polyprenyl-3-methyl-5-hydroxy-6-metoxy-1,4-benzoquinol methylase